MKKLNKKGIGVKYLIALILGLCILVFLLWIIFEVQKENYSVLGMIKGFF